METVVEDSVLSPYEERVEPYLADAWPRFWARTLDISLLSLPAGVVLGLLFPEWFVATDVTTIVILIVVVLPVVLLLEVVIQAAFGNTPGKALVGLRIVDLEGNKVGMEQAIKRLATLYWRGLALGIPLVNIVSYIIAHNEVEDEGTTYWDEKTETRNLNHNGATWRTWTAAILVIGLNYAERAMP